MAEPRVSLTVDLRGLDKVRAKLAANEQLLRPWAAVMDRAGDLLVSAGQQYAPGTLGGRFTKHLDAAPIPRFVKAEISPVPTSVARTGKTAGRAIRYPFVLNAGQAKTRVFHYRSGRFIGRPTAGWIQAALRLGRRQVGQLLRAAARGIEQEWSR